MRGAGVRVLVVGAGIAGLAAARTLRGWGATVEILERHAAPPGEGTGIYLPGNAVRALDTLGLGARVAERAVRIRRQRTADHRGRVLFDVDVDELWNGVGACLALPRTDLHRVLLAGIGDVPIRWGQTPALIDPDGAGVTLQTAAGHTDRYDLVLGADGVHSGVRRLVYDTDAVRPLGVLLIGDAAHATSPNMAQGAAMAFEDAIVLGASLTAADSVTEALAAYERRRRPRTGWVLAQTHRRDRARTLPPAIRNIVLKRMGRRIFRSNYLPLRAQP